jgi:hypothetical protein
MQNPQDPSWIATHGSHPLPLTCSVDGECAAEGGTDLSALLMILGFLALWQGWKMVRNARRKRKA